MENAMYRLRRKGYGIDRPCRAILVSYTAPALDEPEARILIDEYGFNIQLIIDR